MAGHGKQATNEACRLFECHCVFVEPAVIVAVHGQQALNETQQRLLKNHFMQMKQHAGQ